MMVGKGVVLVGASGHALVAIEVLRAAGHRVAGCVSNDGRARADLARLEAGLLGDEAALAAMLREGPVEVFVAIGDNRGRCEVSRRLIAAGARLVAAVSPDASISSHAVIADGGLIMPGAVVNALANIGAGVIVNTGASVDHECSIGDYAHLAPGVALAGNVTVGEGAMVGIGSAVMPGCRIGAWSTVGAGATVVRDVPDGALVVGTPAREIGRS
jgi:UDP-perosamine 4-acetyltransferase